MELKQFIANALSDIREGVTDANTNPNSDHIFSIAINKDNNSVEFDIAVTAETGTGTKTGGGIKVLELLDLGAKLEENAKNTSVTRIKFGVIYGYKNSENQYD